MSELEEQIGNRKRKLEALRDAGVDAYPRRFDHDHEPAGVHATFGETTPQELEEKALRLRVPGRVRAIRSHGRTAFVDISDGDAKLQIMLRLKKLPEEALTVVDNLDLGDYLGVTGTLMWTRTGELTLAAEELMLLSKAVRPMPEKWHGLADVEARYRQRYLDLMSNQESRRVFKMRSAIVRELRNHLDAADFMEVETPMMHAIAGGATARPFGTHHNALDLELYLRIAPELYLKRLLVGGLHRVYEINRNFRNEGISTQHNPEFTMLEFYWAYADYEQMMAFTEEMLSTVAREVLGGSTLSFRDMEIDLAGPWRRMTMRQAAAHYGEVEEERLGDADFLLAELKKRQAELPPVKDAGHLLMAFFEEVAEPHLIQPTFITDHPVEVSPLSKQRPDDPAFVERFELYIGGMEIANAFSELNDPRVQAERFQQQLAAREGGDDEAHAFDADYVTALEHGMPPAAGNGIGIDRLTMLLSGSASIRDVILFPLMRPRAGETEEEAAAGEEE